MTSSPSLSRSSGDSGHLSGARWNEDVAAGIIDARKGEPGAMLPILHDLQEAFGYVDAAAVPMIASALNVSRAEVHGIITFYHDFRHQPAGRHVLKICRAEACQSCGCGELIEHVADKHRLALGETSPDGAITVEQVFCLGNCALSPAVLFDGELVGRVDTDAIDDMIRKARAQA